VVDDPDYFRIADKYLLATVEMPLANRVDSAPTRNHPIRV